MKSGHMNQPDIVVIFYVLVKFLDIIPFLKFDNSWGIGTITS